MENVRGKEVQKVKKQGDEERGTARGDDWERR